MDCKDAKLPAGNGRNGRLGLAPALGRPAPRLGLRLHRPRRRARGRRASATLNAIGYDGPISVEWEDAGMDRLLGAPEALAALKKFDFPASNTSFDAAFKQ